jgi:hypothetical protein
LVLVRAGLCRVGMLMYTTTSNAQTIERRCPQSLNESSLK